MPKIIAIQTHKYAPELNDAYVYRYSKPLRVPGVTTIKQAREFLYPKPKPFSKVAIIHFEYAGIAVGARYSGTFKSYPELKTFLNEAKQRHNLSVGYSLKIKIQGQ